MKDIKAIIQPFMLEKVCEALRAIDGLPGITISHVAGWGRTRNNGLDEEVIVGGCSFSKKTKLEITVEDNQVDQVVFAIARGAHTGNVGDGKIFVCEVTDIVKIRTGQHGHAAV